MEQKMQVAIWKKKKSVLASSKRLTDGNLKDTSTADFLKHLGKMREDGSWTKKYFMHILVYETRMSHRENMLAVQMQPSKSLSGNKS